MSGISTYIVDLDPGKFGGQQENYAQRVETVIVTTANKFRTAVDSGQNLIDLFHDTLGFFAFSRHEIAVAHNTQKADLFGHRRDDASNFSLTTTTTLGGVYRKGHDLLRPIFQKHLTTMHHSAKTKLTIPGEKCFGRDCSTEFAIWNYHNWKEFYIDFGDFEEYKKICDLCSIPPKEESTDGTHWNALVDNKGVMQKLKQASPADYKRLRITGAFWQTRTNFSKEQPAVMEATDWVIATVRFEVESKKMYPLSQYTMSLNRLPGGVSSVEQMMACSVTTILHSDPLLIQPMLNATAKIFKGILEWNKENVKQLTNKVAFFRAHFAHTMPFNRGSNAVCEWFEMSMFRCHGFVLSYKPEQTVDLTALTRPMKEFVVQYSSMIILKPAEDIATSSG